MRGVHDLFFCVTYDNDLGGSADPCNAGGEKSNRAGPDDCYNIALLHLSPL